MTAHEEPRITRLTGTRYRYRCNKCGEIEWGNDHDKLHMEWRKKHWVECWGMSFQPADA
jgi:hypothetical protein